MGSEATDEARPRWDGAWFMLGLLGITTFHGVTMLPFWTDIVVVIATMIGESGHLVISFGIGMLGAFLLPVGIYAVAIWVTQLMVEHSQAENGDGKIKFKRLFIVLPFSTLPLAFTYHLAHNIDHLFREGGNVLALFLNPLGIGLEPMTGIERHDQMMSSGIPEDILFAAQSGLMVLGVWLGVHILRHRGRGILTGANSLTGYQLIPMLVFILGMAVANLWLLGQDMVMRF